MINEMVLLNSLRTKFNKCATNFAQIRAKFARNFKQFAQNSICESKREIIHSSAIIESFIEKNYFVAILCSNLKFTSCLFELIGEFLCLNEILLPNN